MVAGLIDLDVRYLDVDSGVGVAVDQISGRVKNALGVFQTEVTPLPMTDTEGIFYRHADLDVHNPAVYPGTILTVDWVAKRYGLTLPTFSKVYQFAPVSPMPANKTVLYWTPYCGANLLFYQIRRTRGTEEVFVGRSFGPSFVDETVFANEFEARSWRYQIDAAAHVDGPLQPDGSDYTITPLTTLISPTAIPRMFRTGRAMCTIHGQVVDMLSRPFRTLAGEYNQTEVTFRQFEKDRHQMQGDTYILPESVVVKTTAYGDFSVALIQDVLAELWIPFSRYRGRFVVPRKSVAGLSELNLQILRE